LKENPTLSIVDCLEIDLHLCHFYDSLAYSLALPYSPSSQALTELIVSYTLVSSSETFYFLGTQTIEVISD
ncbi:hypothetical protein H5410_061809, partial [Solanum commersonii]